MRAGHTEPPENVRLAVEAIVRKYAPRKLIVTGDAQLLKDVRVWGDDAAALMVEFASMFNVDMGAFEFRKFFRGEGAFLIADLFAREPFWKKYLPINVAHLVAVATLRKWFDPP